jgi:hypothetical protein
MQLFEPDQLTRIEDKLDEIIQLLKGGTARKAAPIASDEVWLDGLSQDPTYKGMDVKQEYGKCVNWCLVNRKQPSRRRVINWLNNAVTQQPMRVASHQQVPPAYTKRVEAPATGVPMPAEVMEQFQKLIAGKGM